MTPTMTQPITTENPIIEATRIGNTNRFIVAVNKRMRTVSLTPRELRFVLREECTAEVDDLLYKAWRGAMRSFRKLSAGRWIYTRENIEVAIVQEARARFRMYQTHPILGDCSTLSVRHTLSQCLDDLDMQKNLDFAPVNLTKQSRYEFVHGAAS
jgi:hypothetical protein